MEISYDDEDQSVYLLQSENVGKGVSIHPIDLYQLNYDKLFIHIYQFKSLKSHLQNACEGHCE